MRLALDTNVLAYAEGLNGAAMKRRALDLLEELPQDAIVLPVQVLGELFAVLVRKAQRSPARAREAVLAWRDAFSLIETSVPVLLGAADLAVAHQLSIWDAVILSAAAEAGCRLLLSEDLHPGLTWKGVTIANPFATPNHPLLQAVLLRPGDLS